MKAPEFLWKTDDEKRNEIGEYIYEHISKQTDEENAGKITGMIIDLPLENLLESLTTFDGLNKKIREGKELLKDE